MNKQREDGLKAWKLIAEYEGLQEALHGLCKEELIGPEELPQ